MGQVIAVDYGKARCGIAATDDLQLIASGLPTVETAGLLQFISQYFKENTVDEVVVGLPIDLQGNLSEVEADIQKFIIKFSEIFPGIPVHRFDERFTSKMASFYISQSGKNKKQRQQKGLTDKVSATLILQDYLEQKKK